MLKKLLAIALVAWLAGCAAPMGSTADESSAVAAASEKLRVAMIDPTRENMNPMVADELSYGHSGGKVDTKASFIADLLSGASDFVAIAITDQTVKVVDGGVAIVRHTLLADTNDGGKPGKVTIKILAVWQKQGGQWKLIARQAIRPPA